MQIDPALLSSMARWMTPLIVLPGFVMAAAMAPWRALLEVAARRHMALGALVALPAFWACGLSLEGGIHLQLLFMTASVLIFGPPLAIVIGCLGQLLLAAIGATELAALTANIVVVVMVPVGVTALVLAVHDQLQRPNYFTYIYLPAFAGGILSSLASVAAARLLVHEAAPLEGVMLPLLAFPEGFVNGVIIIGLVVFRPELVRSFHEPPDPAAKILSKENQQSHPIDHREL